MTLTATPGLDAQFLSWQGDCTGTGPCQLDMNVNHNVTALFTPAHLNDTGITRCGDADDNDLDCPVGDYPGQDAQYGRDYTEPFALFSQTFVIAGCRDF